MYEETNLPELEPSKGAISTTEQEQEKVDEAVLESFPASDPPASRVARPIPRSGALRKSWCRRFRNESLMMFVQTKRDQSEYDRLCKRWRKP
jgi:hypothetical protein